MKVKTYDWADQEI